MGIIRIVEEDCITHIQSDAVRIITEKSDGVITVTMKPLKSIDALTSLTQDLCEVYSYKSIHKVEFFGV